MCQSNGQCRCAWPHLTSWECNGTFPWRILGQMFLCLTLLSSVVVPEGKVTWQRSDRLHLFVDMYLSLIWQPRQTMVAKKGDNQWE